MIKDPLIAAIVGGLAVAMIVGAIAIVRRYFRRVNRCFSVRWREAAMLKPSDLLPVRSRTDLGYRPYYFEREQDKAIRKAILEERNSLVVGVPLAGKTRAVYQALLNLPPNYDVAVVRDADFTDFRIPIHFRRAHNREVVVLDDIDRLVAKAGFQELLESLLRRKAVLIGTSWSGEENEREFVTAAAKWQDAFTERCEFQSIERSEAEAISTDEGIDYPGFFYGPIGSLFLPLENLQKQFRKCSPIEKAVLKALRVLHMSGAFSAKEGIPESAVRETCKGLATAELSHVDCQQLLLRLQEKSFLTASRDRIACEEVLLERIVDDTSDIADAVTSLVAVFTGRGDVLMRMGNTALQRSKFDLEQRRLGGAAIAAYEEALKVHTYEDSPMDYAMTQNNLGTAYGTLAEVEDPASNCQKAIAAYEEALRVRTYEDSPMQYGATQNNLGNAYVTLAEVEDPASNCQKAIAACEEALRAFTSSKLLSSVAMVRRNLDLVRRTCEDH